MKNLNKLILPFIAFTCIFITALLWSNKSTAQQSIGVHPSIDGGFENQSSGNLGNTQSSSAWTFVSSGSTQSRGITATGGYGGPKFVSVGRGTTTSNSSTTINSNQITTGTFLAGTKYIVQFHYRQNALFTGIPDTSFVFISFDGTSAGRRTGSLVLGTPPVDWTIFSAVVTTTAAAQTSNGTCGINIKNQVLPSPVATTIDIDNYVVYPADDQTTPVRDITAPNPISTLTATGNPAVIDLSWSAPAAGIDGGGYVVVRFTSDPTATAQPDPLQNAVYRAASSNTIGTTGSVAYVGTANSFSDGNTTVGTSYWYRVYTVDKAFNYSTAVTTGPVTSAAKTNYFYDGTGSTAILSNWWTNSNGTGTNPPTFTNPGQIFRIITNADLVSTLTISGTGSALMMGAPAPGVPAMTVQFNSANLPSVDTVYQSSDGNPVILNCNISAVPSIGLLLDIFTEIHYRAPGTVVSTSKTFNKIFVENNADVSFTGTPGVQTSFFVEAGSTATVGTLSSRWLSVNTGGTAIINGKLITPKLTGLVSNNVGVAASTGGAIQFISAGDVVLGPSSTIEYSGISSTTTQSVTSRTDYVNMVISGNGVSKTFTGVTIISGTLTLNTNGATGVILSGGTLTVNGGLVPINGKINSDATNLLILGGNATVTVGSNNSHINGPVQVNTNSTNAYLLPLGKNNFYRPVVITPSAATASVFNAENINIGYTDVTNFTAPLTGVSTIEYWDISRSSGAANAAISLSVEGNALAGVTAASELVVARYNINSWTSVSSLPINPGNVNFGTATSTAQSVFGIFTLGIKAASLVNSRNYYIDSVAGNDANPGTLALPWKNISKINSVTVLQGSKILLKSGSTWTGQRLKFIGSGVNGNPIVIDKYGTGAAPLLAGNGLTGEAVVYLFNQQHIEINNLEITNSPNGPINSDFFVGIFENGTNPLGADRRGVMVAVDNFGTASHIYLKNLNIHHIKGQLGNGNFAENGAIPKRTGGIFFTVIGNTEQTSSRSRFNDVLIDSCDINYCENIGIAFDNDWNVYYPGGNEFTDWFNRRYSNVKVSNNVIHHIGKNAMIIRCTDETGLIEKNVCYETAVGTTGNTMFTARAKGTVFQYNEGYLNRATTQTVSPGSIDGSMYDPDFGSVGIIFQYSYSHDNCQGIYWGCNTRSATNNTTGIPDVGDTACTLRYSVSQNDLGSLVFFNYSSAGNEIYNNIFYIKAGTSPNIIQENSSNNHKYNFFNNIIYNLSTASSLYAFGTGAGIQNRTIQNNVFFGNRPADEPADPFKLISDPRLLRPGSATLGINSLWGYKLRAGSPVLANGKLIVNNGGLDYFKNVLPATAPNRGVYQGPAPVVYTFNGNGNWSNAANWLGGIVPPAVLRDIDTIIIDPVAIGECFLDVSQSVINGANISVVAGKKFRLPASISSN